MKKCFVAVILLMLLLVNTGETAQHFIRGDVNQDGSMSLADALGILQYLFGGMQVNCIDALDANDSGSISLADAIRVLYHLFGDVPPPEPPYPDCGEDLTEDSLSCNAFSEEICPMDEQPPCLSAEELSDSIALTVEQSICLPSPVLETELLGTAIVLCPEGSLCQDDAPGCEVTLEDITASIDLVNGVILIGSTITSPMPIDLGDTRCSTDMVIESEIVMEMVMAPTQWDGVQELLELRSPEFTITSLDLNASGSLVCGLLNLSAGVLQGLLQTQIESLIPTILQDINLELGGIYVCTEAP